MHCLCEHLEGRRHLDAQVVGRYVFYDNSAFDGLTPGADARDDAAIAVDKLPLMPREAATFAHVTSYARGINGVMFDVAGLPAGATPTADDFSVRTGTSSARANWVAGPRPAEVSVRRGAGANGSDRVTLIWADAGSGADPSTTAVADAWLEVTVRPTATTGLPRPDVFAFGNLIGETGDGSAAGGTLRVSSLDLARVRRGTNTAGTITSTTDVNRDGRTNALDATIVRRNLNRDLPLALPLPLQLVTYNSNFPDQNETARRNFYNAVGVAGPQHRVDFETGFVDEQNVSNVPGLFPLGMVIGDTSPANRATIEQGPGSISLSNPVGNFALSYTPSFGNYLVLDFSAAPVDYVAFQDIDTTSNNSIITITFVGGEEMNFFPDDTLTFGDSAEFLGFFADGLPRIAQVRFRLSGDEYGLDNIEYGVLP